MVIDSYRYMSSFHLSFFFYWIFDKPRFSFTDDICTIVNRVPPSASACVFAYVAFGPTSGEIFDYRSLTRIQFLNKLKNLFVTPHLHIYNLFIHRRVIRVKKKRVWTIKRFTDMCRLIRSARPYRCRNLE